MRYERGGYLGLFWVIWLITSDVMYLSDSPCSMCVCAKYLKNYERILMKFRGQVERGEIDLINYYGSNQDSFVDPKSFSRILFH